MTQPLSVQGIRKSYGAQLALASVDLEVQRGEVVGLLGANGAGKSTLVSIVAGLTNPDAGTVRICGIDALGEPERAHTLLGVAGQETAVYPVLTVEENLSFFGQLSGLKGAQLKTQMQTTIERLRLADLLKRRASQLSGGERRRLHTAIALIHPPPLLLLDEPTVGADLESREGLIGMVKSLAEDGAAVVYTTHHLAEVEELKASVAVLEAGRILTRGRLAEVIHGGDPHSSSSKSAGGGNPAFADFDAEIEGDRVIIKCEDPGHTAAAVLVALGTDASRVVSIRLVQPSLETAYRALTGRGYTEEQPHPAGQPGVPGQAGAAAEPGATEQPGTTEQRGTTEQSGTTEPTECADGNDPLKWWGSFRRRKGAT